MFILPCPCSPLQFPNHFQIPVQWQVGIDIPSLLVDQIYISGRGDKYT